METNPEFTRSALFRLIRASGSLKVVVIRLRHMALLKLAPYIKPDHLVPSWFELHQLETQQGMLQLPYSSRGVILLVHPIDVIQQQFIVNLHQAGFSRVLVESGYTA